MEVNRRVFLRTTTLAAAASWAVPYNAVASADHRARPSDGDAGGKELRKIPLNSIYTTSEQKGLKAVDEALRQSSKPLEELIERSVTMGASNVFLVRGNDVAGAVQATRQVFTGSSVDEPVPLDQRSEPDSFWVVAYFGISGSGEAWLVRSVEVTGKEVRITFKKGVSENNDEHPYFAWVPIGKLDPGTYTLELFDQRRQQATLVRRVVVRKK